MSLETIRYRVSCSFLLIEKKTQMKILYFDGDGYALWCKRLEQGQFVIPDTSVNKKPLSYGELQCELYGIDWQNARRY